MSAATSKSPPPAALLSFPKSGRTWLKLMLKFYFERAFGIAELPLDEERRWSAADARIPPLIVAHDGDPHFKRADEIGGDTNPYASRRIVFLVRDPRDIMVSLFFEMTRRTRFYEEWGFDTARVREQSESLARFIRGPVGRLETLLAYWRLWERRGAKLEHFLLLRYEEMHADARAALGRVFDFLAIERHPEALSFAVEQCRFEKMRAYEEDDRFASKTLRPADREDRDSYKVRRGQVGGYREYFTPADLEFIDRCCEDLPAVFACYKRGEERR